MIVLALLAAVGFANAGPSTAAHRPFEDVARLPAEYRGNDFRALMAALKRRPRPVKSEFETEARYRERLSAWKAAPLLGKLYHDSRIALVGHAGARSDNGAPVLYRYDAETQTFAFWAHPECDDAAGLMLDAKRTSAGTYVGQNAYGVKRNIRRIRQEVFCVRTVPEIAVNNESFKIPPYEATVLSSIGKLLVVGTLTEDEVDESVLRSAPTIGDPEDVVRIVKSVTIYLEEVWLFNPVTGEVFGKWKP